MLDKFELSDFFTVFEVLLVFGFVVLLFDGVDGVVGFVGSVGVTGAGADTVIVTDLLTLSLESLLWSVISPDIDTV